ncbi:type II secretion system GspH family protein [Patescibacteria group bacterium]|nr:type II secretion system GspH family protein [Patescibacteria group bacterium]
MKSFNKRSLKSGFTLIEMLVVIAMIGLLSAVLLVALGPSRKKAQDTRIISDLNQVRNLMEVNYNPSTGSYSSPYGSLNYTNLQNDIANNGGSLQASTTVSSYVYYSRLSSSPSSYYCVDSNGFSAIMTSTPAVSKGVCQ